MNNYRVRDVIAYKREGFTDPGIGVVLEKLPNACFAEASIPQQTAPIHVMVRNEDIIKVMDVQ